MNSTLPAALPYEGPALGKGNSFMESVASCLGCGGPLHTVTFCGSVACSWKPALPIHSASLSQLGEHCFPMVSNNPSSWKITEHLLPNLWAFYPYLVRCLDLSPWTTGSQTRPYGDFFLSFSPSGLKNLMTVLHLCEPKAYWKWTMNFWNTSEFTLLSALCWGCGGNESSSGTRSDSHHCKPLLP